MKYIKMNKSSVQNIKEFKNISLDFWEFSEVRLFYSKKIYKVLKKYRNILFSGHIVYKRKI